MYYFKNVCCIILKMCAWNKLEKRGCSEEVGRSKRQEWGRGKYDKNIFYIHDRQYKNYFKRKK